MQAYAFRGLCLLRAGTFFVTDHSHQVCLHLQSQIVESRHEFTTSCTACEYLTGLCVPLWELAICVDFILLF